MRQRQGAVADTSDEAGDERSRPGATPRSGPASGRRRQRADARQSISAILRTAADTLNADPAASMEDIARAAGVTRQTVYAHFPSRGALLAALTERATAELTAAFEAAGLDDVPPAVALNRLLDAGWRVVGRNPFLWPLPPAGAEQDRDRHGPVLDRLLAVIERGQETGDFDRTLTASWLLAAALAVSRTADGEVKAGRMTIEEASGAVHRSVLRLFGIPDPAPR